MDDDPARIAGLLELALEQLTVGGYRAGVEPVRDASGGWRIYWTDGRHRWRRVGGDLAEIAKDALCWLDAHRRDDLDETKFAEKA